MGPRARLYPAATGPCAPCTRQPAALPPPGSRAPASSTRGSQLALPELEVGEAKTIFLQVAEVKSISCKLAKPATGSKGDDIRKLQIPQGVWKNAAFEDNITLQG
ncbi:hypothetical protein TURU_005590 [Turdus rufiventris]|nr:hypothetical protein TURU_005590 [Turdus rufiventris]